MRVGPLPSEAIVQHGHLHARGDRNMVRVRKASLGSLYAIHVPGPLDAWLNGCTS